MYKILKNIIEMDDYSVQKLSNLQPPEPFEWNTVEGTELNVSDCIGGKGKIEVKGNTYQKQLSGKNFLDTLAEHSAGYSTTIEGVTFTLNEDGTITANGTVTGSTNARFDFFMKGHIESTGKRMTGQLLSGTFTGRVAEFIYDADWGNTLYSDIPSNSSITTRGLPDNVVYARTRLIAYPGAVINNAKFAIMIVDQSETDLSYEPYCGEQASPNPEYPQEIKVVTGDNVVKHTGKNLFDKDNANIINAGISSKVISTSEYNRLLYIPVKSSTTYTIQRRNDGDVNRFRVGSCTVIPANNVSVPNSKEKDNETNITITTGVNDKYLAVMYYRTYETVLTEQQILNSIQIEEGTTATPYEEYRGEEYELSLGNMELCKIGDYEDILFKNVAGDENYNAELESGAWYKKKAIDKKVLDDLWEWFMPTTNRFHVNITLPDGEYDLVALCDKFINALYWTTHINTDKSFIVHNGNWGNNMCRISFVDKNCASLAEWTQFVSENNLIVYHRLLNPTYEKITDTTLISQLEALKKAKWFKGVNHWWTETNNLEPVLKGTYRQAINE